jgi:hypothetical protein
MLIIVAGNKDIEWHLGQKLKLYVEEINEIHMVQADGDELEHILSNFKNLPAVAPTYKRVVRWWGNDAKFIASNIIEVLDRKE